MWELQTIENRRLGATGRCQNRQLDWLIVLLYKLPQGFGVLLTEFVRYLDICVVSKETFDKGLIYDEHNDVCNNGTQVCAQQSTLK